MRKSKTSQILAYIAKNPKAKPLAVAQACGVKLHTVYNVTYMARKATKKTGQLTNAEIRDKLATLAKEEGDAIDAMVDKVFKKRMSSNIVTTHHTDMVNEPPHYKIGGVETIDFIEAKKLDYNLGNVVKYITRADHKGDKHEDLCKARWYLNRAIASVSNNT